MDAASLPLQGGARKKKAAVKKGKARKSATPRKRKFPGAPKFGRGPPSRADLIALRLLQTGDGGDVRRRAHGLGMFGWSAATGLPAEGARPPPTLNASYPALSSLGSPVFLPPSSYAAATPYARIGSSAAAHAQGQPNPAHEQDFAGESEGEDSAGESDGPPPPTSRAPLRSPEASKPSKAEAKAARLLKTKSGTALRTYALGAGASALALLTTYGNNVETFHGMQASYDPAQNTSSNVMGYGAHLAAEKMAGVSKGRLDVMKHVLEASRGADFDDAVANANKVLIAKGGMTATGRALYVSQLAGNAVGVALALSGASSVAAIVGIPALVTVGTATALFATTNVLVGKQDLPEAVENAVGEMQIYAKAGAWGAGAVAGLLFHVTEVATGMLIDKCGDALGRNFTYVKDFPSSLHKVAIDLLEPHTEFLNAPIAPYPTRGGTRTQDLAAHQAQIGPGYFGYMAEAGEESAEEEEEEAHMEDEKQVTEGDVQTGNRYADVDSDAESPRVRPRPAPPTYDGWPGPGDDVPYPGANRMPPGDEQETQQMRIQREQEAAAAKQRAQDVASRDELERESAQRAKQGVAEQKGEMRRTAQEEMGEQKPYTPNYGKREAYMPPEAAPDGTRQRQREAARDDLRDYSRGGMIDVGPGGGRGPQQQGYHGYSGNGGVDDFYMPEGKLKGSGAQSRKKKMRRG